ncbi:EAL domain-containing protein [Tianweitania sp. BSSL-BM11]|uniref:EAL domain-containing protein n=1 Tax=Tianweitania aestuarii TaxID=2814886 RepID=A0ABS5RQD0_9HYPH|nr:GGDEF domain-containing phosphodiesterase [Tianweitania aestuarii]MBS9719194.1 EAL domain-containing protein [Tianweitania aestuarii]
MGKDFAQPPHFTPKDRPLSAHPLPLSEPAQAASAEPEAYLAALVELATPVLLADAGGRVSFVNRAATALLGCTAAPAIALDALFASCGVGGRIALPDGSAPQRFAQLKLSDGRAVNVEARLLPDGGAALTLTDVSAFVREAERARRDPLTGLVNRVTLHATLGRLLQAGKPLTLMALDLDRFKSVNDTLGHPIGDTLLRKVAERLGTVAEDGDVVARLGGDEFTILKPGSFTREQIEIIAKRIVDLVGRTYALEGHMIHIGASVGITQAPHDGSDNDVLMKNADLALYRSKAEGRGRYRFFEQKMDEQMQARRAIELDLRQALALQEFELAYQPQVDLATQEVVGFEALLRWRHATRGLVSPLEFIPVAEETGLIGAIGEWVLRTACRDAVQWPEAITVGVNLSPLQFRNPSLAQTVMSALASSGLAAERLELEITENALLEDTDTVLVLLKQLRDLGVRVSMDDFGTGYSSLAYLQKFPFDRLKIDQSFVRGMGANPEASAIVRAVAALGASLGIKTTAEGVETEEQLAAIRNEGCTHVQGYFTGRPMALADARALLVQPRKVAAIVEEHGL